MISLSDLTSSVTGSPYLKLISYVLVFVIGSGSAWIIKGWKDDNHYQNLVNSDLQAKNDALDAAIKQRDEAQNQITANDQKYNEDMTNAKRQIESLHSDIASGAVRLSIPSKCKMSVASHTGGSIAETRTELDPTTANALVAITDRCDQITRQNNTLIDTVNSITSVYK